MQRFGRSILAFCIGILSTTAVGCGSNQGCEEYATAYCTRQVGCSNFWSSVYASNFETCRTTRMQRCQLNTKSPDTSWTQDLAMACSRAINAESCDEFLAGVLPTECRVPGKRTVGAPCGDRFQCESLQCVVSTEGSLCGSCTALPKQGESCGSLRLCDDGLQCVSDVCQPLRSAGEPCSGADRCKPSLACMVGTCQDPMFGGACNSQYDCNFHQVQYCDGSTLTCEKYPLTVATVNEACGISFDSETICTPDAYCRTSSSASFGVCTKLPTEGQACATSDNLCASPYTCIGGVCKVFDRGSCK